MNNYCRDLNLAFELDLSFFKELPLSGDKLTVTNIHLSKLDNNLKSLLDNLNIKTMGIACFYTPANSSRLIHIDDTYFSNMVKINYVFGGYGSEMQWYKFNGTDSDIKRFKNVRGDEYVGFNPADCELVYSVDLRGPSLINAGVPHGVTNNTNQGRWCISHGLHNMDGSRLQWDDAMVIFKNYLK